ncbi:MAG TPA: hypothetical protein VK837_07535 [Longimicrobiales bacterium]|nr:hypothetical protein [Longimicrobiales bacterium]
MPRTDLPEIEDQPWCPHWIRDAMTGYLQVVNDTFRPCDPTGPALSALLDATGFENMAGDRGPIPVLSVVGHPSKARPASQVEGER